MSPVHAETLHDTAAPKQQGMRRRTFLGSAAASGSLVVGFHVPLTASAQGQGQGAAPEVNAWVVVQPDERVIVRIARSEMGQGTLTGLAQMVAEELECDWARVTTEYPTPGQNLARNRVWGNFSTGGCRGIRESQDYVRKGGAAARMMLVQAAAQGWNVPAAECRVSAGVISHPGSNRRTTYGQVAAAAARLPVPTEVPLKDPKDWKLVGKRLARLDTVEKTNGSLVYGADLKLPGMLHAAIKDCPVFGGKVKSFSATAVAVVGNARGDAKAVIGKAARKVEAVYAYPFQNHATMEPMNATARWTAERCEVWTPTQNGESALAATAAAAGLPPARCDVYKLPLGGGFGRRGMADWVTQAVLIARELPGTPVKLLWSREEDMQHGRYHPITQCKLTAGLDDKGEITGLHMRISGQSILAGVLPHLVREGRDPVVFQGLNEGGGEAMIGYSFPALLIDHAMRNPHVPPGFWRGVNLNQNAIYLECFVDEIAHATRQDPLALRRKLMANHPKHLAVLNAAAERAGWGRPAPDVGGQKVYRGLAQTHGFGSYVAACAEVSVSREGALKIHRIVAATDCGYAVNPQQIEAQIEGSFVYGLGAALFQECTVKDGAIEQKNFDTYPSLMMGHMPKVECVVMPSGGFWGGVGEPTIAVAAPAVLTAIFAATGKRIRELPLKHHSLKA